MPTIDADAHVIETERTWEYMEGSESQFKPAVVRMDSGRQFWLIGGRVFSRGVNVNLEIPAAVREMRDIEARLRHMDELEIDVQVLYPSLFLRALTLRPEIDVALSRSYNRWVADLCSRAKGRLRWVAVVPLLDMRAALAEASFAVQHGACGLFMRGIMNDKILSDPYFYPLYEKATELNVAVCVHASSAGFQWVELFERESGFAKFKLAVLTAFHALVHDGLPSIFPGLRFGFIEVRAQWVPYVYHELARRAEKRAKAIDKNWMRENRLYVACQTDDDLPYVLKYAGEDNLVIGSDYGHADTSSEIEALRNLKKRGDLEPEVIDRILYDNPKTLYNL
ncbi:MAG TPA: amidohydrolase family protein [Candidatus Acidoferrales bacterium]|nr:amidohydrolase family protein [Candidatus Acidoferrales bacterium]